MIIDFQTIIIIVLTAVVAGGIGMLWGISRYTHLYDWFACDFIGRMQRAMKMLDYSQEDIDRLLDRMGEKLMMRVPPPPQPPTKDLDLTEQKHELEENLRILKLCVYFSPLISDEDAIFAMKRLHFHAKKIHNATKKDFGSEFSEIEIILANEIMAISTDDYSSKHLKVTISCKVDGFIFVSFDTLK